MSERSPGALAMPSNAVRHAPGDVAGRNADRVREWMWRLAVIKLDERDRLRRREGNTMGMRTIEIEYPDDVLTNGVDEEQVRTLAREAFFVRLYERGLISSGRAARALDMTRWDFLDLLGRYDVSYFDENTNFDEELRRARP